MNDSSARIEYFERDREQARARQRKLDVLLDAGQNLSPAGVSGLGERQRRRVDLSRSDRERDRRADGRSARVGEGDRACAGGGSRDKGCRGEQGCIDHIDLERFRASQPNRREIVISTKRHGRRHRDQPLRGGGGSQ